MSIEGGVSPGAANQTAQAAADEAGTGSVEATTVGCEVLCIGMFFDGTNNSRLHVGKPAINWHTNVDLLEHVYAVDPPQEIVYRGQTRLVTYDKLYMRGIGVNADGTTNNEGGALGTGEEGVANRVRQAIDQVNQKIPELSAGKEICDIVFDVFGFSRGSAAARHFVNQVLRFQAINSGGARVAVRFLGIFDCVSSIGIPGSPTGTSDVSLNTLGFGQTSIFHVTAQDEIRVNFPLTRAAGREVSMVGSHSDIGGGRYPPSSSGHFYYSPYTSPVLHRAIIEKWGFGGGATPRSTNGYGDRLIGDLVPPVLARGSDRIQFFWTAKHGLQFVSMRLMYDAAKQADVPFPASFPARAGGKSTALDSALMTYYQLIGPTGVCTREGFEDQIRHEYTLFPGANELVPVNAPEVITERRVVML